MKKYSKAIGAAAAILWIMFWITAVILQIAGDGRLMEAEMMRCAPPETTGLAAAEYPGIVDMTTGYLTGRTAEFQYTVRRPSRSRRTRPRPACNPPERARA